jgi:hypothetical protein
VQVTGCKTTNTWDTGIVVGFYSYHVVLEGNIVERSRCHGIDVFNVSHVLVGNNIVRNWNSPHYKEQRVGRSVGIFVHPDWGISTFVPTSNIVVSGNQVIYDAEPEEGVSPQAIEVTGNVDTVCITGNTLVGGCDGFFVRSQSEDEFYKARADKRVPGSEFPRNVVFSGNVCRDQSGRYLWISGDASLDAWVSNNVFAPAGTGFLDIGFEKQNRAVLLSGNIFRDGNVNENKLGKSVVSQNNVFLPGAPLFRWTTPR